MEPVTFRERVMDALDALGLLAVAGGVGYAVGTLVGWGLGTVVGGLLTLAGVRLAESMAARRADELAREHERG